MSKNYKINENIQQSSKNVNKSSNNNSHSNQNFIHLPNPTHHRNLNSINYNPTFNNNNNYFFNSPIIKINNDPDVIEKSGEKDLISNTENKNQKYHKKIFNKDKQNLLKIVNMYMKGDKKSHSKIKLSSLLKSANKKQKKSIQIF